MPLGPGHQRLAIWTFSASGNSYTDRSIEARSVGGTGFPIFSTSADFLYIGLEDRFDMAIFLLSTNGAVGNRSWFYYDGDTWNAFSPTIEYDFTSNGAEKFERLNNWRELLFTSTVPHAATPPDNITRYWIRCSVASVTTAPVVNQIIVREYAAYATSSDVAKTLQLNYDFASDTIPTKNTVEDYIHNAQSKIDYETRKSWRPNIVIDEEHDYIRPGFALVNNYPTQLLRLQIWNGGGYDTKTEGRGNDYFLVPEIGMVYYSRFFNLPARIQAYSGGAPWGEFSFSVRVSYIYGSNVYNEREGGIVNDMAKKLAALDVLQNHDYSLIIPSGADRISLERKSDLWRAEIEENLARLQSFEIF